MKSDTHYVRAFHNSLKVNYNVDQEGLSILTSIGIYNPIYVYKTAFYK